MQQNVHNTTDKLTSNQILVLFKEFRDREEPTNK